MASAGASGTVVSFTPGMGLAASVKSLTVRDKCVPPLAHLDGLLPEEFPVRLG